MKLDLANQTIFCQCYSSITSGYYNLLGFPVPIWQTNAISDIGRNFGDLGNLGAFSSKQSRGWESTLNTSAAATRSSNSGVCNTQLLNPAQKTGTATTWTWVLKYVRRQWYLAIFIPGEAGQVYLAPLAQQHLQSLLQNLS